ncbi:MAG: class I SAM-dependent methyltransferase [Thermoplasmata archaeon]
MRAEDWDQFFVYQAKWAREARNFVYRHTEIFNAKDVLELGCGTGVITQEIAERCDGRVVAIDINREFLEIAKRRVKAKNVEFMEKDAHALPFPSSSFDRVYFANFLMWVREPDKVFSEIVRVLRPSGYLGILSEPDYGGRVDYPCGEIRERVVLKLRSEGANPFIGRRLRELCKTHGLESKLDALQGMFSGYEIGKCYEFEVKFACVEDEVVAEVKRALDKGIAFLLVPIIYGYGWKSR